MDIAFNMLRKLCREIFFIDIFEALFVGIRCLFQKPVTKEVSEIKRSPKFRTKVSACKNQCIKCGRCSKICPSKAIKVENGVTFPIFDLDKCCYCNLCQKSCPRSAINITSINEK